MSQKMPQNVNAVTSAELKMNKIYRSNKTLYLASRRMLGFIVNSRSSLEIKTTNH